MKEIARRIANEPKEKYNNPRIPNAYKAGRVAIITQSENVVLLARSGEKEVKEYPVKQLGEKEIMDTNGAGDAFTGGFLAMYIHNKSFDKCIECAIYCATECIKQHGCTLPKDMTFKY